jgi:hypothetical protein
VTVLTPAVSAEPLSLTPAIRRAIPLLLLFSLGTAAIWGAPKPLMTDLAQHAGQVALLRDLLLGRSPWAGQIHVNLVTPYLLGYGLALPLSFLMPVAAALKVVLTAAYAAFIAACLGIRRELGASPKLDAYYAFSFFGFAYSWGMYTFLVAAPLGLAVLWLAIRYAREARRWQGLGLALMGLALLFSHGLVFLFAVGAAALVVAVRAPSVRAVAGRSWPFWVLLAACAALFVVTRERESAVTHNFAASIVMGSWQRHGLSFLANAFDAPYARWSTLCFPIFAGLPLLAGFRPDWRAREAVVIFGATVAAIAFAPSYAWSTTLLFERFALFLPPAYAWLLRERAPAAGSLAARLQPRLAIVAVLAGAAVLAQHAWQALEFGGEQRDFDRVMAAAQPGQRALALIYDPASAVDANQDAYQHHALWYQAERQGLVDFNFAMFHPQVARFRPQSVPLVGESVARDPRQFDWRADQGERYRYVFVRSRGPTPANAFSGALCPPVEIAAAGEWRLYEQPGCWRS